jgi:hypothetical protein
MSIFTIFLWIIVILFGLPMFLTGLALKIQAINDRDNNALENIDFRLFEFQQLPWFVRWLLSSYRKQGIEAGFSELACFTRKNIGAANFVCVQISRDRQVLHIIEYARINPLFVLILMCIRPRDGWRFIVGVYGATIVSVFQENRRLITTKQAFLAIDPIAGEKEYNIVQRRLSFEQQCTSHLEKAKIMMAEYNLSSTVFNNREDYFNFERIVLKKLVQKCKDMEIRTDTE